MDPDLAGIRAEAWKGHWRQCIAALEKKLVSDFCGQVPRIQLDFDTTSIYSRVESAAERTVEFNVPLGVSTTVPITMDNLTFQAPIQSLDVKNRVAAAVADTLDQLIVRLATIRDKVAGGVR
jgi:hypothetical protein